MNQPHTPIDEFFKLVPQPLHDTGNELIRWVTSSFPNLDYAIKWNQLTFALNKDFHHWLFSIKPTKKSINIVFHFGGIIEDPDHLLIKGDSFFIRKIEYSRPDQTNQDVLVAFINQAISKLDYFRTNWKSLNK